MRKSRIVAFVVAACAFAGVAYFLFLGGFESLDGDETLSPPRDPDPAAETSGRAEPPRMPPVTEPEKVAAPVVSGPEPIEVPLPALGDSDPFVRERVEPFGWPESWVSRPGLASRLAVVIESAQRSELPRRPIAFLKPKKPFAVIERDGKIFADPSNPSRFDPFLDFLEQVPPETLATTFVQIEPLLDAAMAELGSPQSARAALSDAIDQLFAMQIPEGELELIRPNVLYKYADESIETLPELDKQLLRLGPQNRARIRSYTAAFQRSLEAD